MAECHGGSARRPQPQRNVTPPPSICAFPPPHPRGVHLCLFPLKLEPSLATSKINMTHPAFSFACTMLLAIVSSQILLTEAKPKFLLSCKVIAGICQNDGFCLDEMSIRFPDCYLEGQIDSFQPKIGRPALVEEANASQRFLKRAPAMKLMKVLMMKDRIPVGRR